ncbi:MAG: hypothetical protein QX192_00420, partial [Methylococcales bacterium]
SEKWVDQDDGVIKYFIEESNKVTVDATGNRTEIVINNNDSTGIKFTSTVVTDKDGTILSSVDYEITDLPILPVFSAKINVGAFTGTDNKLETFTLEAGTEITGGLGVDKFVFASPDLDTTTWGVTAIITDFVTGSDKTGSDKTGSDKIGSDKIGSDKIGLAAAVAAIPVKQVDTYTITAAASGNTITIGGIATADVTITLDDITGVSVTAAALALKTAIDDAATGSTVDVTVASGVVTMTAKFAGIGFTSSESGSVTGTTALTTPNALSDGTTDLQYLEVLTPVADFSALMDAADLALNGHVDFYFGVVGSNGYLFHDVDGIGHTNVIQLPGVTDMAYSDIIAIVRL